MKKFLSVFLGVFLIFALVGCGEKKEKSEIKLNKDNLVMTVSQEETLELLKDGKKIEDKIIWGSTQANVATVYNGTVKALKEGNTVIQAVYNDDIYECNVEVKAKEIEEIDKNSLFGAYKASPYLEGMNMTMNFSLQIIDGDKDTFIFNRADSNVSGQTIPGEELDRGEVEIANGKIILKGTENRELDVITTINYIALQGKMSTGAPGKEYNMTFKKFLENPNEKAEKEILHTFVGSNSKPAGPMGVMSGAHIIHLYKDGTMDINCGFFATVTGNRRETYKGSYTLKDDKLDFTYKVEDREYSVSTTIKNGMFRAAIFLCATIPGDDTENEGYGYTEPGYSYYEIDSTAIINADKVYAGTKFYKDGNFSAYVLRMYNDGNFDVRVKTKDFDGTLSGKYKIIEKELEDNVIRFEYNKHIVRDGKITDNMRNSNVTAFETSYALEYVMKFKIEVDGVKYDETLNLINCK